MKYDVVIIGGGVVGACTARALSRYRLKIAVLERAEDVGMGASRANSAIVHGGFDPVPGTLKAKLNVEGCAMMEEWTRELEVPYLKNGSLVIAFSEEEMDHVRMLYDRGIQNGVPDLSVIDGEELRRLESRVSEAAVGALYAPSAGIVCPYELTVAAMGNAMDHGADLYLGFDVKAIEAKDGLYEISDGTRTVTAQYVINCAGTHADDVARTVGDDSFKINPRKGEYMLLDRTEGDTATHTLFQVPTAAGKGVLVTPTVDNNLLVGPTSVLIGDKENYETTREGLEAVRAAASKTVPDINYRAVITSFTGLRAALEKGDDFIIRESDVAKNFFHAAGIDSPGLSSAPAIALYLTELLKKSGLALDAREDYDGHRESYHRFRHMSEEEKNRVIEKDPAYGRMICRCETVTEGEIRAAIRRNPQARTFDAVKRRVRSGMGRCQGGFCTTYITEILADELGIAEKDVTKSGGASYMLTGELK